LIDDQYKGLGLAPMAVLPERQRSGVGTILIRESLARLWQANYPWVVVLGHPKYYPRFGFVPAGQHGIHCEYDAPLEAFMVMELRPGQLKGISGIARFHRAFAAVD